ncbi:MAG: 4'-phosphopantetheinyl transferase superfamily protein [Saprospiraceae bacterium]
MWLPPPSHLHLTDQKPQVWQADLLADEPLQYSLWECLSPDEKARANRFRFAKDKDSFVLTRGILRHLLGRYLQQDPKKISFAYGPQGKPSLIEPPSLHFNVTHSGELALFAFALNQPIGVDLEHIQRAVEIELVAKHFFSAQEIAALFMLPAAQQKQGFFNCWTRKEALIKAMGTGLAFPLAQFEVSLKPGDPAALLATHWDPAEAQQWFMTSFKPAEEYVGALAIKRPIVEVAYWQWPKG